MVVFLMMMMMMIAGSAAALQSPIRKAATIATGCAAGVCAGYELRESLYDLGHHHGLALLAVSKVAHALSLIEIGAVETAEEIRGERPKPVPRWRRAIRLFYGSRAIQLLCVAALFASLYEVYVDIKPGGHHGTALLALAEFRETTELAAQGVRANIVATVTGATITKLAVGLGALVCAVIELAQDSIHKVGAHHGVALLALAYVRLFIIFFLILAQVFKNGGEVTKAILDYFQGKSTAKPKPASQ